MSGRGGSVLLVALATTASLVASSPVLVDIALPPPPPAPAAPPPTPLTADELVARTVPVVVTIDASAGWTGMTGTGIVLTPDGTVVTNHHVVSGATDISAVSGADGSIYDAEVLGYDRERDLAVLQLGTASDLPAATIADILPPVGSRVTAFGNSEGGGVVVATPGTIVEFDRNVVVRDATNGSRHRLTGMIRTDAPIRPGDSGGPLVDDYGTVVGINTAGAVQRNTDTSPGTRPEAYAVPIAEAMTVVEQVRAGASEGSVHVGPTPRLGASVTTARKDGQDLGVEVLWVSYDSPAYRAGLDAGDVVVSFDGEPVSSTAELEQRLLRRRPGDVVSIEWTTESGEKRSTEIVLESGPAR
ncbi:serine protease [Rhodococcus gordoniae]|uniref:Serine protease n=1 Tax=Rhodococcus gordoniae TaxID=223392 RepID=A0A379M3F7_9NOCA|nr:MULTISPECIES: trypsin-like peptidase domain-containing protein [Rhodococcus]SUE16827.1 serine protease [Rhodococcus gordoniae]